MRTVQSLFVIGGFILFLGCLLATATVKEVASPPAPQPTPFDNDAAVVDAVSNLLDIIQVDEVVLAAAEANRQDTESAHTSEFGQLVKDVSPALPWCTLGMFFIGIFLVALVGLGLLYSERKRQALSDLTKRLGEIEHELKAV